MVAMIVQQGLRKKWLPHCGVHFDFHMANQLNLHDWDGSCAASSPQSWRCVFAFWNLEEIGECGKGPQLPRNIEHMDVCSRAYLMH